MSGWRKCVMLGLALGAAGGCAYGRKPYANDPLIRSSKAVWGDFEKAKAAPEVTSPEPAAPGAPNQALIGSPDLVTRESDQNP